MSSRTVVLIQHGEERTDNRVETYLREHGYAGLRCRPDQGERLPADLAAVAGCVVFGGLYDAFGVDEHPFLRDEHDFIRRCIEADIPLLGICQGAQMIAWQLGARVGPPGSGMHEFGYYEIRPTEEGRDLLPRPLHVVQSHWHGFDIPTGAVRLASSMLFPNQAFRFGDKVYGFQFHAEVTPEGFRAMQARGGHRYVNPGVQPEAEQNRLMALHDAAQDAWFTGFLRRLFTPIAQHAVA